MRAQNFAAENKNDLVGPPWSIARQNLFCFCLVGGIGIALFASFPW